MTSDQGSVLVACPTYAGKEYALDRYLAAYRAFDYEPRGLYMVDNTGCRLHWDVGPGCSRFAYFERLKREGVHCTHLDPFADFEPTFRRSWQLIYEEAVRGDWYWILSMEADNTIPPDALSIMVEIALYANIHLVTHTYPMHRSAALASGLDPASFTYEEMGCMLLSTKLLGKALADYEEHRNIPLAVFASARKWQGGRCSLTERFKVEHLDGYEMEFWQFTQPDDDRLFCPTPQAPSDYGTFIPPAVLERALGPAGARRWLAQKLADDLVHLKEARAA